MDNRVKFFAVKADHTVLEVDEEEADSAEGAVGVIAIAIHGEHVTKALFQSALKVAADKFAAELPDSSKPEEESEDDEEDLAGDYEDGLEEEHEEQHEE